MTFTVASAGVLLDGPWLIDLTPFQWFQYSSLTLASLAFFILILRPISTSFRWRLPPGPLPIPGLGNLGLLVGKDLPHQMLAKLSYEPYDAIMTFWLGTKLSVVVSSPEDACEVLREFDAKCSSRDLTYSAHTISDGGRGVVFSSSGEYHWKLRKFATMNLLTPRRFGQLQFVRHKEVFQVVTAVCDASRKTAVCERGGLVEICSHLLRASMNNIMRVTIGKSFPSHNPDGTLNVEGQDFVKNMKETVALLSVENIDDYIPGMWMLDFSGFRKRCKINHQKHRAFMKRHLDRCRSAKKISKGDKSAMNLCEVMLAMQEDEGLEETDMFTLLQDLVIAGSDTGSVTSEWALGELVRHPAKLECLQAELDTCFNVEGASRAPLTVQPLDQSAAKLNELPYLQAVIAGTFRLHPLSPLLIPHLTTEAVTLGKGKYTIPAGTIISVNAWSIGHDPAVWLNPHEFHPERFVEKRVDVKGNDYRLLPFGSGRRGCPGMTLGLAMVTLSIASMAYSFDLKAGEKGVDMREKFALAIEPMTALEVVVRPRV